MAGGGRRRPSLSSASLDAAVAVAGVIGGRPAAVGDGRRAVGRAVRVNVDGVRRLAAAAVPALLGAPTPRQGRVVAVASAAGLLGFRRLGAYTASKHAVIGLIAGLAADLAGTGVTANAVCPGSTRTRDARRLGRGLRAGVGRGVRRASS